MSKLFIGVGAVAIGAVVAVTFSDIKRYLRIRSM